MPCCYREAVVRLNQQRAWRAVHCSQAITKIHWMCSSRGESGIRGRRCRSLGFVFIQHTTVYWSLLPNAAERETQTGLEGSDGAQLLQQQPPHNNETVICGH